jgi:hypothetical protein
MLGTLAEAVEPELLRGYIEDDSDAKALGVSVDEALELVMGPIRWMMNHCQDRMSWYSLGDNHITFFMSIPDFASFLALVSRLAEGFQEGSPQEQFLREMLKQSGKVLNPEDLMALWSAASEAVGHPNN